MLRTRLSSRALRAQVTAVLPAVPAIPAQHARASSQRGLASAVLLSSRENWQSKTVKNLKEALVQRGLPQYGNKKALITRLEDYETKSTISAASNAYARNTSSAPNARHISSSAIRNAEASNPASDTPVEEMAVPKVQVLTEAPVNIQNLAKEEEADPSTVPGVPEEKAQAIEVEEPAYIGAVNIPIYEEKPDQLAIPPFLPDNFAARAEESMAPPTPDPDANPTPKVISVAADAAETARHSLHETVTNLSHDVSEKAEEATDKAQEVTDKASKAAQEFPPLADVLSSVEVPSVPLGYITSGLKMPSLKGGEEFKPIDRPLNSEERKGAFVLFGILAGGILLGGGKKKHDDHEEQEHKEEEKH